jgi:hypothetical protein
MVWERVTVITSPTKYIRRCSWKKRRSCMKHATPPGHHVSQTRAIVRQRRMKMMTLACRLA